MLPLDIPETLKVYMLLSVNSSTLYMNPHSVPGITSPFGSGIFHSKDDAEKARTLAILSDKNTPNNGYYVYELELPNPAFRKTG